MGKHTQKRRPHISIPSGHPGCAWDLILHVVKYPDWHYVKKRLPHRWHDSNKQAIVGDEIHKKTSDADTPEATSKDQVNNFNAQEARQETPAKKTSVKARIKSLVNEEFSKRKGQHLRTSTYPARSRFTRTYSIHHLKPSPGDFIFDITTNDESPETAWTRTEASNTASSMDSLLKNSSDEPPTANGETGEGCEVHENKGQNLGSHRPHQEDVGDEKQAFLGQNLINTGAPTADPSVYRSKEFQDALDTMNLNKEFFLKILHDPRSPFGFHFHNQQTLNARMGLTKSESFPLPGGLSGRRDPGPSKLKHMQDGNKSGKMEEDIRKQSMPSTFVENREYGTRCLLQSMPSTVVENREDGIRNLNQTSADIVDNSSSGSTHHLNNPLRNQVVIKRFKDLKQKITHAIKESKNERHRITMDAILHKVPHNQGFSKDLNDEILDQLKDPSIMSDSKYSHSNSLKGDPNSLTGSRHLRMRRTPSINETLDRYNQLYETTFNRQAKQPVSEGLKLQREEASSPSRNNTKSLGRIFSLPEIKSYYYQNEVVSDASSLLPVKIPDEETGSKCSVGEQNSMDVPMDSENGSQIDTPLEIQVREEVGETYSGTGDQVESTASADGIMEVDKLSDDLITLTTRDSMSDGEWDFKAKATEPSPLTVFDFSSQEVGESSAEFSISEESEEMLEFIIPGVRDSLTDHQYESSMDAPLVAQRSDPEISQFSSKHLQIDSLQEQVDAKDKPKFDYVKYILELTGFSGNESLGTWHSEDLPVDPSVYEEVGGCILLDPDCSGNEGGNCNHMLFFDLINEVLMEIYERSYSYYPKPLSSRCYIPQMPAGNRVLKEVWRNISGYLSLRPELHHSLDYITGRDLSKNNGWMNLQFNSECVALEVEDLIFEDLIDEVIFS